MLRTTLLLLSVGLGLASLAQAQPVRGLIVELRPSSGARESAQASHDRLQTIAHEATVSMADSRALTGQHHRIALTTPLDASALVQTLQRLRAHGQVLSVEPDVRLRRLDLPPNDPAFATTQQWSLQPPSAYASGLNLPGAWSASTGANQVVAVLDSGIRPNHPDLTGRLVPGYDFVSEAPYANDGDGRDADPTDPGDWVTNADINLNSSVFAGCTVEASSWHGSFIAGLIGATTNNGLGMAGVNWSGKVLPVRVAGKCGASVSDVIDGMRWAAGLSVAGAPVNPNPARVINLSFGGDTACSAAYQSAINEITAQGALLVVAAGNSASTPTRPADCQGVLAVAALSSDGAKARYSSLGTAVSLAAPGGSTDTFSSLLLYSLTNTGTQGPVIDSYGSKMGTSFSAPLAAGVASLALSLRPTLTSAQLRSLLLGSTRPFVTVAGYAQCGNGVSGACNCTPSTCGSGMLDASLVVAQAGQPQVVIQSSGTAVPGGSISLDGSASVLAVGAAPATYLWSQLSGPTASLGSPSAAQTSVVLSATAGTSVFTLTLTDNAGRSAQQQWSVTTTASAGSGNGSSGHGGGAAGGLWGVALWALVALAAWERRTPSTRRFRHGYRA